ncbi:MAG TPA: adenylate/guanylate cyclase domain-containing protein, partial [Firmicutes bacterium]|nr:adenylate/guanylate cyclase domain-containing protein [Bacillota bacterium]
INETSKLNSRINTAHGKFTIGLHQVLEEGAGTSLDLGQKDLPRKYFMFNKAMFMLSQIEEKAARSEILLGKNIYKNLKDYIRIKKRGKDYYVFKDLKAQAGTGQGLSGSFPKADSIESITALLEKCSGYLMPGILSKLQVLKKSSELIGEHRRGAIVFINTIFKNNIGHSEFKEYFNYLQVTAHRFGGIINKVNFHSEGVKIIVLFGFPYSHEDDIFRAVKFSKDLVDIQEKNLRIFKHQVGINSGYVFAGVVGNEFRKEYTVMGDVVNVAARISRFSGFNSLLVTESVAKALSANFTFNKGRQLHLKGKKKTERVFIPEKELEKYSVEEWISESKKMVGRQQELKHLEQISAKAEQGELRIAAILGEAGLGKSRFIREMIRIFISKNKRVIFGDCHSYGQNISFLPWKLLFKNFFNLSGQEKNAEKEKELIKKEFRKINREQLEWLPLFYELNDLPYKESSLTKSLDAKLRRQRLFDMILDFFKYYSKNNLLIIIIEDVHWMDNASTELLNYLTVNMEKSKVLVILGTREINPAFNFIGKPFFSKIQLKEFSKEESMELIKALVNIKAIPDKIQSYIMSKSQGNPFYVEEVIKSFLESGLIVKKGSAWIIGKEIKKIDIPDNIQDIIMSRIDRLEEESRHVLQLASIIGREFSEDLLLELYKDSHNIRHVLGSLKKLDLIKVREDKQVIYFFKHILTQEVAYESISFQQRRQLHNELGEIIESSNKRNLKEKFDILSHHYFHGQNWYKAFIYSMEAAEKAQNQYSNQEALQYYDQSLKILDKFSESDYEKIQHLIKKQLEKTDKSKKNKSIV